MNKSKLNYIINDKISLIENIQMYLTSKLNEREISKWELMIVCEQNEMLSDPEKM